MGKTVIVVGDRPGFWVNRILSPYLNEAGLLVAEGVPIEVIDRTMTALGLPGGPDRAARRGGPRRRAQGRGDDARGLRRPDEGRRTRSTMLAAGRLGRKNGRGFYRYRDGHKAGVDRSVYGLLGARPVEDTSPELIERRLVYAMLNEAAAACSENVVRSARDGDIGAIFGIGFPAFRGGPLRVIDDLGASRVVSTLHELEDQYGERFRPAPALAEMARQGGRYYADMTGVPAAARRSSRLVLHRLPRRFSGSANPACSTSPAAAASWWSRPPSSSSACGGSSSPRRTASGWSAGPCRPSSGSGYWLLICHGNAGNISEAGRPFHYAGPPGAGTEPVRLRLPRLRRERRRAHARRGSIGTPTPPTATCAIRWTFRRSGSSSSAIRSARPWRWSW